MGCATSNALPGDQEARLVSKAIDAAINTEKKAQENIIKLLLLGAGETGKSTILKQMKLIYSTGFTPEETLFFRNAIIINLVTSIQTLVTAMHRLRIPFGYDPKERCLVGRTVVHTYGYVKGSNLDAVVVEAVKLIWADSGVQYCYSRRNEYHLMDCCAYLMTNIDRITQPDFMPTDADILNARVMTAAITETKFTADGLLYRVFDVGGQRSERKKWAGYFEDVNSILFLVAISGYDLMCYEDDKTNQIVESKNVFSSICNHPMFKKTNIVLFMNKIDLFKEKVTVSKISQYFPQYTGKNEFYGVSMFTFYLPGSDASWEEGSDFFTKDFLAVNKYPERAIYPHLTWATDTNQIKVVINTVHMEILKQGMAGVGIL
ncbi:guanine nucleotide binding protein, alpha subunit [Chytriomyces sp. MP71]|nr:guanine nucleotide binding protein, alpha subunit [Chytriomyces sp. MP71]